MVRRNILRDLLNLILHFVLFLPLLLSSRILRFALGRVRGLLSGLLSGLYFLLDLGFGLRCGSGLLFRLLHRYRIRKLGHLNLINATLLIAVIRIMSW